ncbi:TonB-dependent receptor plug domain-containing protein [Gemmatimonas aurantiaca]|uniref:TonB-dependent receptor plug domain-containing protein n=1 Tax=Gemmatimonas aurantiaca TaxID=173480 RepID=UPI00301DB4A0
MLQFWRPVLALAGLLAGAGVPVQAQQSSVGSLSVTVTDAANQRPVEAARVFVVGTAYGGQTTGEGKLTLRNLPTGSHTIRVLRVGYTEQTRQVTIAAGAVANLDVSLTVAAINLAAVVTTATGEQRRVEIGNATANIDAAKVTEVAPVSNVSDLLNSRAPGVTVTSGSQTGTGARIRVRGTNSVSLSNEPIWIIDGIRMTSDRGSFATPTGAGGTNSGTGGNNPSRTGDINPEEIESIEIVKGPSAATLYGTDAANGVILVTTKKGRSGAPRWTFYGEGGTIFDKNWYPTAYSLWGKRTGGRRYRPATSATSSASALASARWTPSVRSTSSTKAISHRWERAAVVSWGRRWRVVRMRCAISCPAKMKTKWVCWSFRSSSATA